MEDDDDDRRSLQVVVNSLYCHEEPLLVSTPPPPPPPDHHHDTTTSSSSSSTSVLPPPPLQQPPPPPEVLVGEDHQEQQQQQIAEEEKAAAAAVCHDMLARQGCYAPSSRGCYLRHLLSAAGEGVAAARSRGVHYVIYVTNKLGLAASTAFNAVNYLDRFLSINCHLRWDESWMVELVSVACLSVACKLDEVNIPSLHHLQMEEVLGHSFRPATVRDMELTLLKALQWRLACVTPYSFLHLVAPQPSSSARRRCTRLLLRSLAEPALLLRFDPSVVAAAAIRCCLLGRQQQQDYYSSGDVIISRLLMLIRPPADCATKDADECFEMMQALLLQEESSCSCLDDHSDDSSHHHESCYISEQRLQKYSSGSPVPAGIPFATHGGTAVNRRSAPVVTRRLFAAGSSTAHTPSNHA